MSFRLKTFIKVGASAFWAALFLIAGCGGNSNPGSGPDDSSKVWGGVGDWLFVGAVSPEFMPGRYNQSLYYSGGDNQIFYYSFKQSGDIYASEYQKVNDFWLESAYRAGSWYVEDSSGHVIAYIDGGRQARVDVSGDSLAFVFCDSEEEEEEDCETVSLPKSSVAAFKESAGAIKVQDPDLINTVWRIELEDEEELFMYVYSDVILGVFYEDSIRGWYRGYQNWYTDNNRLILMSAMESGCKIGVDTIYFYDGGDGYMYEYEYEYDCDLASLKITIAEYIHVPGSFLTLNYENGAIAAWEYYGSYDGVYQSLPLSRKRAAYPPPTPIYHKGEASWSISAL